MIQPVHIPTEILTQIISHIDCLDTKSLHACCLVSTQWYSSSIARLYERPALSNSNFERFAATLCPPRFIKYRTGKHDLSDLIHRLDLGTIGASGSSSIVNRLLSRTRKNLEVFVAPTYSFSVPSLIPLSKSSRLRTLDLRNAVRLSEIMKHLCSFSSHFPSLQFLALPRKNNFPKHADEPLIIPTSLQHLVFSGYIPDVNLHRIDLPGYAIWPETLEDLTFTDCDFRHLLFDSASPISDLLKYSFPSHQLRSLNISSKQNGIVPQAVEGLGSAAPNITSLSLPMDLALPYITEILLAYADSALPTKNCSHVHQKLERLEILPEPHSFSPTSKLKVLSLRRLAQFLPSLWRIEIPTDALDTTDDVDNIAVEDAQNELQNNAESLNQGGRQPPIQEEAGLFDDAE